MGQQMSRGEYDAFVAKYGQYFADASGLSVVSPREFNDVFRPLVGRDLTAEEQSYWDNIRGWKDKNEGVRQYAGHLTAQAKQILGEAQARGLKDFTIEDATKLRDQTYNIATGAPSNVVGDLTRASLDRLSNEYTQKQIMDQVDRATNPAKYLSDEQKAANAGTAQRLLKTNFGDDFQDQDLQQFLTDRLAEGESAFEVSQFLQTTPQYMEKKSLAENERVKTESAAAREALNQELLKSQQEVFQRAQPAIISSYMKAGRLNSSGLQSALAQAQTDLEKERQGFLANAGYNDAIRAQGYGRENFVNNSAQAFNSYLRQNEPAYQQKFAVNQAQNFANFQQPYNNLNRQYQLSDQSRQRQYDIEDYDRQQSDYNRYMSNANKQSREAALYGLLGSAVGSGIQGWAMRK